MERFFGGSPGAVVARLTVLSIVVGIVLNAIGLHPFELVESLQRLVLRLYNMGFRAFEWLFAYLWLGAIVVVPVWLVSRIWTVYYSHDRDDRFDDLAGAPGPKAGSH